MRNICCYINNQETFEKILKFLRMHGAKNIETHNVNIGYYHYYFVYHEKKNHIKKLVHQLQILKMKE